MSFVGRVEARARIKQILYFLEVNFDKNKRADELSELVQYTIKELSELHTKLGKKIFYKLSKNYVRFYKKNYTYNRETKKEGQEEITICSMRRDDFGKYRSKIEEMCDKGYQTELFGFVKEINEGNSRIALKNQGDRNIEVRYSEDKFIKGLGSSRVIARMPFKKYVKNKQLVDDYVESENIDELLQLEFVNKI